MVTSCVDFLKRERKLAAPILVVASAAPPTPAVPAKTATKVAISPMPCVTYRIVRSALTFELRINSPSEPLIFSPSLSRIYSDGGLINCECLVKNSVHTPHDTKSRGFILLSSS